jgi:thiol-disulfide isomerase/thioredoxin
MTDANDNSAPRQPLITYGLVAALSGLLGFGAVYAILRPADNSSRPSVEKAASATQAASTESSRGNPLASGEMGTFVFRKTPEPLPDFTFVDAGGKTRTIADWKGKVVLLNLWATWCAPCRKEMPALDRLQKELGSDKFEVVALSVDRQGAPASKKFLEETKVSNLKLYVESTSKSIGLIKAPGLPTTLLIDSEGREVGRLAGPAEWDSADAKRLIQSILK